MKRVLRSMSRGMAMALLLGCPGDDAASTGDTATVDTGAAPEFPYEACDNYVYGCGGADCTQRTVEGADFHVCGVPCIEDADCPPAPGSNAKLTCDPAGHCAIECNPSVGVCPSGTTCVAGDPPQCMWALDPGVATLEELCTAACDGCMAAVLLGWPDDCPLQCAADLADCNAEELQTALECPGDADCAVGGLALNSCLRTLACKD